MVYSIFKTRKTKKMKKNVALYIIVSILIILPFIYLFSVYSILPQSVPTHFGLDGTPDAMSDKSSLWSIISFCAGTSLFVFFLLRFLPAIDPKRKAQNSAGAFVKMGVAAVVLLSVINCLIINSAQKGVFNFNHAFPALLGIFFAFIGNNMYSIKLNYFAGIRTPWTLESEETWRKTHQLAGKLWFIGGLLIAIISILLPSSFSMSFLTGIVIIITIIPVVYSYIYFKSSQKTLN